MKAIIWIVVLALVVWGVWALMNGGDAVETVDTGAAVVESLDSDAGTGDIDISEFEDKG